MNKPRLDTLTPRALRLVLGIQPFVDLPHVREAQLDRQIGFLRVKYGFAGISEALGSRIASRHAKLQRAVRGNRG